MILCFCTLHICKYWHQDGWQRFCELTYLLISYSFSYTNSDVRFVVRQASGQINHYSQNVGHNLRLRFVICREIAQLTGDSPRRIQSNRTSCVVGPATAGQQMPSRPLSVCPSLLLAYRSIAALRHRGGETIGS